MQVHPLPLKTLGFRWECASPRPFMPIKLKRHHTRRAQHPSLKDPKPKLLGTSPQDNQTSLTLIQRESARWHCAARREITERSEEAPEAKDAQPSRNDGIWKALEGYPVGVERYESPAGSSGGSAEGASEGRQPLTGPLCRLPRRQPKQHKRKSPRARRAQIVSAKTTPFFVARLPDNPVPTANNVPLSKISPKLSRQLTSIQPDAPNFNPQRKRTMALRGAKGDHRA